MKSPLKQATLVAMFLIHLVVDELNAQQPDFQLKLSKAGDVSVAGSLVEAKVLAEKIRSVAGGKDRPVRIEWVLEEQSRATAFFLMLRIVASERVYPIMNMTIERDGRVIGGFIYNVNAAAPDLGDLPKLKNDGLIHTPGINKFQPEKWLQARENDGKQVLGLHVSKEVTSGQLLPLFKEANRRNVMLSLFSE